ncbi:MAG: helix-turn-helix transcriptional regulator [Planctomycetes bacterium]|nr:helix-turn-helix transcriptional regulator [Planctomycetota bacterium]
MHGPPGRTGRGVSPDQRAGSRDAATRRPVGLAPSHFGKKFRQSTGLSLHRFVNRRRLQASLGMLRDSTAPLARVSCDLGFSSQSHFMRLCSELIGITPARYRKLRKANVG